MTTKACKTCGVPIEAQGNHRFCPSCGVENLRKKRREASARELLTNPEQVRARKKRYRDLHAEELREKAKDPKYRVARDAWRDRNRFGGLKEKVLDRDDHRCRACGSTNDVGFRNLPIHHIDGNKTRNVMENLITLCRGCHARYHYRGNAQFMDELRALIT